VADSSTGASDDAVANRVALTVRAVGGAETGPGSERLVDAVSARSYRRYLGRARAGPVAVGEEWTEFVNCGCGTRADVVFRVVAVEGGERVGPDTAFAFEPAPA